MEMLLLDFHSSSMINIYDDDHDGDDDDIQSH